MPKWDFGVCRQEWERAEWVSGRDFFPPRAVESIRRP